MRKGHAIFTILLAAMVLATGLAATNPQTPDPNCEYQNETGHYICGQFLDFYNSHGGLEIFGYPLTEAFNDPTRGGLYVQYFQRARMEWHPLTPTREEVQLGRLAAELGYRYPPTKPDQIPSSNGPLHRYFPQTKHVVSYAFLDYFREHGGIKTFGYPLSDFMYEGGRVVQYFERARMEWHPEREVGSQIRLTKLGEMYLERFGIPGNHGDPRGGSAIIEASRPPGVTELVLSTSVDRAITGRQGSQTLFVYVDDQRQRPVEGASVTLVARYPSNRQYVRLGRTNERGFARGTFEILPTAPGQRIILDVTVTYQGLRATTQTFFLVWW
jgi:hypothetical protein